jgi:hypothetical protein
MRWKLRSAPERSPRADMPENFASNVLATLSMSTQASRAVGCRWHDAHLSVIAHSTRLVRAQEAPRSFADLLEPKWVYKLVKAHPVTRGPS